MIHERLVGCGDTVQALAWRPAYRTQATLFTAKRGTAILLPCLVEGQAIMYVCAWGQGWGYLQKSHTGVMVLTLLGLYIFPGPSLC